MHLQRLPGRRKRLFPHEAPGGRGKPAATRRQPRAGVRNRSSRLRGRSAGRQSRSAPRESRAGGAGRAIRRGSSGGRRPLPGSARNGPRRAISGMRTRRDCWLLSRATRAQRSLRFAEASKRPFSVRAASTGRMRSTPSSVAFSMIHSKRSNLMRLAQRVMETGERTGGRASMTRNATRSPRASVISAR